MNNSHCKHLVRGLVFSAVALAFLVELPVALAQKPSSLNDTERQKVVQKILDASDGGIQSGKQWELKNHWVGDLEVVVTTGAYSKGGHLAALIDARSVRLNAIRKRPRVGLGPVLPPSLMSAWGKHSTSHYSYRESMPSVGQLRDKEKHLELLASFGPQRGWTDAWGDGERMHWTEGWNWFSVIDDHRVRVLSIFAHVSSGNRDKSDKSIDHMIIRQGLLRKSDPTNIDDLKRFPTAESTANIRQQKIEQDDSKFPEPLQALLKASHARDESDLKSYFGLIGQFRKNPDPELLKQLVAHLDDRSLSFSVMAEYLFDDKFTGATAGPWPAGKRAEACVLLIRALPNANSKESMQGAVELILRESGFESFKISVGAIKVDITSRYTKNGRTGSYSSFEINEDDVKRTGEIIRDELLRLYEQQR